MVRGIKGSSEIIMSLGLRFTVALLESIFVQGVTVGKTQTERL